MAQTGEIKNPLYFSQKLSGSIRRIFFANLFQTASNPLLSIFIGAFIWRATGSFVSVALYSAGYYLFLPIAFWFNGKLLERIKTQTAFWCGTICGGITGVLVAFLGTGGFLSSFFFGSLWGLGNGFYWANRNYLEFQETADDTRRYYFSMLSSAGLFANILIPFIAGWFIQLGTQYYFYSLKYAYWTLFIFSFLMMLCSAKIISDGNFQSPVPDVSLRLKNSKFWSKRRVLNMALGMLNGLGFVSTLVIFLVLGNEGILGTAAAIVSLITAAAVYYYGRYAKKDYRHPIFLISIFISLLCAAALAFLPRPENAIIYVLVSGAALGFISIVSEQILLFLSDIEAERNSTNRYSFVLDNEIFLNTGRLIGIGIVCVCVIFISQSIGLFYGPLCVALIQLALLGIFYFDKRGAASR